MRVSKQFSLLQLLLAVSFAESWSPIIPRSLTRKLSFRVLRKDVERSLGRGEGSMVSSDFQKKSNMASMKQVQPDEKQQRQRRKRIHRLCSFGILAVATVLLPTRLALASDVAIAPAAVATTAAVAAQSAATAQRISLLQEIRLSMRLVFAAAIGSLLGWERSSTKHSAGIRTMALVSLGAATFTICSSHMFLSPGLKYDPSRMAANVASGVGFIGAGVITTPSSTNSHPNVVHGLTTAAAIWISAAVGVAAGAGLYFVSGMASAATIAVLRFGKMKKKPTKADKKKPLAKARSSTNKMHADGFIVRDDEPVDTTIWDEHARQQLEGGKQINPEKKKQSVKPKARSSTKKVHREGFIVRDDEPVDTTIWDEHAEAPKPMVRVRPSPSSKIRHDKIANELNDAIQDAVRRAPDQEVLEKTIISRGTKPSEMVGVSLWNSTSGDDTSASTYGP